MKRPLQIAMIVIVAAHHHGGSVLAIELPTSVVLADYSSATASLFNNMKTTASILAAAMVPVGLLSPLKFEPDEGDGRLEIFLRRSYPLFAVTSLTSELLSVMWATIAVNQLVETKLELTTSVWHLILRDFQMPWVATNAHFVLGMMGFMWVVCCRAYFVANKGRIGASCAGICLASFLLLTSIVNRGVAAGGGEGLRFGTNILSLFYTYGHLLVKRAFTPETFGPLELGAIAVAVLSTITGVSVVISKDKRDGVNQKKTALRRVRFVFGYSHHQRGNSAD